MKVPQLSSQVSLLAPSCASAQKHISLQRTPRFLSTPKCFLRTVILLLLMLVSAGAWATDYVFVYNGNYLGIDDDGQIKNYTKFNPTYCVWTCYNGTNEATLANNTSYSLKNGSYYLNGSNSNGSAPTVGAQQANWRLYSNYLYYRTNNSNTAYYLYYRSGWKTSSSSNPNYINKDNVNYYNGYSSTGTRPDYRATDTASTTSNAIDNTTLPTVSCDGLSGTTGILMSHTELGGTYTPAATTIVVGGTTYYKGSDGKYSTTAPSATLTPTYNWSINSGSASITSDGGVLTLSNNNAQTVIVRLTVTNTNPNLNKTVNYTLTVTKTDALNEPSTSDMTITPSSATLDLGGTTTYTVSPSINQITKTRPAYVSITAGDATYYKVENTYQASEPEITETPGASINLTSVNWTFSGGDGNYYTASDHYSTSNTLTLTRNTTKTATKQTFNITASAVYGSVNKEGTATVTIPLTYTDLTALHAGDAINVGISESESLEGHYTWEPNYDAAGAAYKKFTYTSGNTNIATVDANGKVTGIAAGSTTITIQSEKMDGTSGVYCDVTVNVSVPAPEISIASNGTVTITPPVAGLQIRYTTDGSNPTATTGNVYSGTFPVSNETVVKAVAVSNNTASSVATKQYITSGISGDKVILNDYEDHNWTYYKGVDASVDDGHYNTTYLGKMYSPDPRNVKITYQANGGAVSISESETEFVYYKTIEKVDNAYKYQVISNPFSKRPTGKGFGGWKLKSITGTGASISGHTTTTNAPLALDEELTLTLPDAGVNGTSAEIVFEATWVDANITYVTSNPGSAQTYTFNSGTYETNLIVLKPINNQGNAANYTQQITISGSATIMMVEPDGSADYRNRSFTNLIVPATGAGNTTKIEWASWDPSGNIDARGRNLTIGRGVTTGTARELYGTNQTAGTSNIIDQVLKIESGNYSYFRHFTSSGTNRIRKQIVIFGCDYDRAKGDNAKLSITGRMIGAEGSGAANESGTHDANLFMSKTYMKSGTFMSNVELAGAGYQNSYYLSINSASNATGKRLFEMEGGYLANSIAGGMDVNMNGTKNSDQYINVFIRIRGGHVLGCIYGAARKALSQGSRQIVLTGGEVNGWIAGGANGDESSDGSTAGASYIYVGGNAIVGGEGSGTSIGSSIGGCVYGAGCGYGPNSSSGQMELGTNVVVADNAYIERGVYGGGAFGYCKTDKTANIYITGGHVEGKSGDYKDRQNNTTSGIIGGVFGGARMRYGGSANIYMTGGQVDTGVYGGSNYTGTLEGNVKMVITGGQVGTDATHTGNVHGGGYGASTIVTGNVDITLGKLNQKGVTLYGNVYGGSAMGRVNGDGNGTATINNKHTNVTLNAGTIHGKVFGGGMGRLTGTGRNATPAAGEGAVNGQINVTVNGTDPTTYDASDKKIYAIDGVFGGCDMIAYNGTPKVIINNCESSIDQVYGGGNASNVTGTDVTINAGDINYVFGGGNGVDTSKPGANVNGNAVVNIYGGTINNIFGGSNTLGDVTGTATVTLEDQNDECPITAQEVYGGANEAPMTGSARLDIQCLKNRLEKVFGGSRAVDVNNDIVLNITGGQFGQVFGGNNVDGNVKGSITVNVDETGCKPVVIDELYCGGDLADYSVYGYNDNGTPKTSGTKVYADPKINIISCTSIGQVFGGGLGATAIIYGDPHVNINLIEGAYSNDITNKWNNKLGTIGDVFGGGNAANIVGDTYVNIGTETTVTRAAGGTATVEGVNISGNVYGGGNQADVTGKTHVQVGPKPTTN